jgi:hypothetical protein
VEPLSLPFSVARSKGAYALLLGSGVSRSAEILTGWDITRDLIRQVALLSGETLTLDQAEAWYCDEFEREPDYSDLLKELARTPADRRAILHSYFVPTQEERAQNIKVPQDGHHAIAELVGDGYVRVIVTTNFDTLIEDALTQAGVDAQVISTVDALKGATPLPHAACTVFKVHGDYRDARIRNTKDELSTYPSAFKKYLDRIFDEYGLIVCGWSCEWDPALRAALERRPSRRYATYWTHLGPLKEEAQRLTARLSAELIQIAGADQFFRNLSENVKAIEDTAQPHPLSARVAEATVKRYVAEDRYRILLSDLVLREARRVHDATAWPTLNSAPMRITTEELEQRLRFYQTQSQSLMAMMVAGCYWGEEQHHRLWGRALRRLSHFQMQPGGRWIDAHYLQLYPTLLAIYSGGIAALGGERYDTLAALLLQESWPDPEFKQSLPMAVHAVPGRSLPSDLARLKPAYKNSITPVSNYLRNESGIREATREVWMDDDNFDDLFDWFEFFLGMVVWHLTEKYWQSPQMYRGGFAVRNNPSLQTANMPTAQRCATEIDSFGSDWPPLRAGFFEGALARAVEVFNAYTATLNEHRFSS